MTDSTNSGSKAFKPEAEMAKLSNLTLEYLGSREQSRGMLETAKKLRTEHGGETYVAAYNLGRVDQGSNLQKELSSLTFDQMQQMTAKGMRIHTNETTGCIDGALFPAGNVLLAGLGFNTDTGIPEKCKKK